LLPSTPSGHFARFLDEDGSSSAECAGAQAILTARGWDQSDRFDEAWALLAAEHQRRGSRARQRNPVHAAEAAEASAGEERRMRTTPLTTHEVVVFGRF
jgi:hypothetical protein